MPKIPEPFITEGRHCTACGVPLVPMAGGKPGGNWRQCEIGKRTLRCRDCARATLRRQRMSQKEREALVREVNEDMQRWRRELDERLKQLN